MSDSFLTAPLRVLTVNDRVFLVKSHFAVDSYQLHVTDLINVWRRGCNEADMLLERDVSAHKENFRCLILP